MERKTVLEHLIDLRKALLKILLFFGICSGVSFIFGKAFISFLRNDLIPKEFNITLVLSSPTDFLVAWINIAIFAGIFLSIPAIIYQTYRFVVPALSQKEKRFFVYSLISSVFLFFLGFLFGYFVLLRFTLWFLASLSEPGLLNLWNINSFLSFAFFLCITSGLMFTFPIFAVFLSKCEIIDSSILKSNRPYAVVGMFVLAAIITPPDPFSQIILAVPMMIMYEIAVVLVKLVEK